MLTIAIVEDDESEMSILENAILRYKNERDIEISIAAFNNAEKFLTNYKPIYDVVFLDIELDGMNGMDAAAQLRKFDEEVSLIFVTNMAQYALGGYKVGALDYFLKPISYFDLKMRMERIRRNKSIDIPLVKVPISGGLKSIPISEINFIEIMNHTLTYHTDNGYYEVRGESLKKLEKTFGGYGFARCNSSYLVSLRKCKEVVGNTVWVGNDELVISRALNKEFIAKLKNFLDGEGKRN